MSTRSLAAVVAVPACVAAELTLRRSVWWQLFADWCMSDVDGYPVLDGMWLTRGDLELGTLLPLPGGGARFVR